MIDKGSGDGSLFFNEKGGASMSMAKRKNEGHRTAIDRISRKFDRSMPMSERNDKFAKRKAEIIVGLFNRCRSSIIEVSFYIGKKITCRDTSMYGMMHMYRVDENGEAFCESYIVEPKTFHFILKEFEKYPEYDILMRRRVQCIEGIKDKSVDVLAVHPGSFRLMTGEYTIRCHGEIMYGKSDRAFVGSSDGSNCKISKILASCEEARRSWPRILKEISAKKIEAECEESSKKVNSVI